jgi:cystathionine beta-lyase/cystathionine gamma-synthase
MGPPDLPADLAALSGVERGTVRLSLGLEDPADLIADIEQALQAI